MSAAAPPAFGLSCGTRVFVADLASRRYMGNPVQIEHDGADQPGGCPSRKPNETGGIARTAPNRVTLPAEIQTPVRIVEAIGDQTAPAANRNYLARRLPNRGVDVLASAGHFSWEERGPSCLEYLSNER